MDEGTRVKRRLAAILAADAVGYSARMAESEERTLQTLAGHRRLIDSLIADHGGRIVGTAGDSVLAEFGSSVDAVRCAVEVQEALATRNASLPEAEQLQFRIGINLGDVIVDGADILGDGVNVASRLEGIAEPGGICIPSSVFDQISGKLNLGFEDIGNRSLKNIGRPVHAYRVARAGVPQRPHGGSRRIGIAYSPVVRLRARDLGTAAAIVAIALAVLYVFSTSNSRSVPPPPAQFAERPQPVAQTETSQPVTSPPAPIPAAPTSASPPRPDVPAQPATPSAKSQADRSGAAANSASAAPRVETPAPSTPTANPGATAANYTTGLAQARCQRPDGSLGPFVRGRVQVEAGEVIITVGEPDQPGHVNLRGKPDADGMLVLDGFIIPVAGRGRGTKVAARYEGRLNVGRGMLSGTQGVQRCTLRLQLK
jgi:class 3 adenylate cyclase